MARKLIGSLNVLLLLALLAGCASDPPPFRARALQEDERARAAEARPAPMRALPTTAEVGDYRNAATQQQGGMTPLISPATRPSTTQPSTMPVTRESAGGGDPTVRLALQELIQRAVKNSLDVRVKAYQPAIDQSRVIEEEARFDPVFFITPQVNITEAQTGGSVYFPPGSFTGSNAKILNIDKSTVFSIASGVRQLLPSGGKAELRYEARYVDDNPDRFVTDPYYENDLVLEVTQPLLRDFGTDITRARISVQRNSQRISLLDFRDSLEDTAAKIEKDYWQLVQAERELEIQQRLLKDTTATAGILQQRMKNDVSDVQFLQADATVKQRQAVLIRAEQKIKDLSDEIKRFVNDPDMPVSSSVVVLPADAPLEVPIHFDFNDQVATALENRAELAQQQLRVDSATIAARVGKNNLLPQLNLVGAITLQGLGQDPGRPIQSQAELEHISWKFGLEFEIPIGNRGARATWQRSLLQRQQAIDQYRALLEQVTLDVKTAQREVETSWREMVATRLARFAAADSLRSIVLREEKGNEPLTPTFVQLKLDRQGSLAEAERAEAGSISSYNIAIANLERSKGTLLRYNNVQMAEEEMPFAQKALGSR